MPWLNVFLGRCTWWKMGERGWCAWMRGTLHSRDALPGGTKAHLLRQHLHQQRNHAVVEPALEQVQLRLLRLFDAFLELRLGGRRELNEEVAVGRG